MLRPAILRSIPGIVRMSAFTLLIEMPALVAMRFNPDLKSKYRQLIDAGKPAIAPWANMARKNA